LLFFRSNWSYLKKCWRCKNHLFFNFQADDSL